MKKQLSLLFLSLGFLIFTPSVSVASIDINLRYGSRGTAVSELQDFLISRGFLAGQTSGNFFSLTRNAVTAYQKSVGLPTTGFVGPMTREKINAEISQANTPSATAEITETGNTTPSVAQDDFRIAIQQQIQELLNQIAKLNTQISQSNQSVQAQPQNTPTSPTGANANSNGNVITPTPVAQNTNFGTQTPQLPTISSVSVYSLYQTETQAVRSYNITPARSGRGEYFGSLSITVANEPVIIKSMRFTILSSNPDNRLEDIYLWDNTGSGAAGPVDENIANKTFTFADPISLPVGTSGYGRLDLEVARVFGQNGDSITISTNPSKDWIVQGKNTGVSAFLPDTTITLRATIKGPSLSINFLTNQTVTKSVSANGVADFGNIELTADGSEGIKISGLPLILTVNDANATTTINDFNGCNFQHVAGTDLNPGYGVLHTNNFGTSGAKTYFEFGPPIKISKGMNMTLVLKCNILPSAKSNVSYQWSVDTNKSDYSAIGDISSIASEITTLNSSGPIMTVSSGQ